MIGNMCSCLEVRFPHKRLFAVCYLLVIPYSVILKLEIDTTTFVCPQFPSDFTYQFHTEDRVYYKTDLARSLDSVALRRHTHL